MNKEEINKQRTYWHERCQVQFLDILFASMEGDKEKHRQAMDDLATSLSVVWRFDHKLRWLEKNGETQSETRSRE